MSFGALSSTQWNSRNSLSAFSGRFCDFWTHFGPLRRTRDKVPGTWFRCSFGKGLGNTTANDSIFIFYAPVPSPRPRRAELKHLKLLHLPLLAERQVLSTNRILHKQSPWQINRYALWLAPRLGSARIELVGHFVLSNCLKHGEAAGEQGAE